MFITPTAVFEFDAPGSRTFAIEPNAFRLRPTPLEILRKGHFHGCYEIDDFPHVFTLGGGKWSAGSGKQQAY
jgi:hypothetical protein